MNKNIFNLNKIAGRKRIKDRGIQWQEVYIDKSKSLKKKFDKSIGPGAYRRWEGNDFTTGSKYYVVVGPTIQKKYGKCFFSGIKKLPAVPTKKTYSPYGEYYPTIAEAYSHAAEKWGVPYPKDQVNYTRETLANIEIPEHIKG